MMDGERPQKFRIGEIDRPGVLRKEFERFEQGPVLDVLAELRTVVNSVEGVPVIRKLVPRDSMLSGMGYPPATIAVP
jgi:hypothetical protein